MAVAIVLHQCCKVRTAWRSRVDERRYALKGICP